MSAETPDLDLADAALPWWRRALGEWSLMQSDCTCPTHGDAPESPLPHAQEPASGPGTPDPHTDRGTGVSGSHARTETAVDTIARLLIGDDWGNGVVYTDHGHRDHVRAAAERIQAALRPIYHRDTAQRLRDEATTRAASAPDAVAYHRAIGIREAAVLLDRLADDMGDTP